MTLRTKNIKSGSAARRTMAVGVFDGVHAGHQFLIKKVMEVAEASNTVPSIMTFTPHPLEIIRPEAAPSLLTPIETRCQLIRNMGCEVVVRTFDENTRLLTADEFLRTLNHDYGVENLIVGFNHRFGSDGTKSLEEYRQLAAKYGISVNRAGAYDLLESNGYIPVSSSSIRKYIQEGKMLEASRMLTRPYDITGVVVEGKKLGHTIGFPTANLRPLCRKQLVPLRGVYACQSLVGNQSYPAVVNIGSCPTIGRHESFSIEAHIIGLDCDLYGDKVNLKFLHRLRDEHKFPTIEALSCHISADKEQTLKMYNNLLNTL